VNLNEFAAAYAHACVAIIKGRIGCESHVNALCAHLARRSTADKQWVSIELSSCDASRFLRIVSVKV